MSGNLGDLQQRAVELAKTNDYGAEALELNLEIARLDAANQGAWTRLARCYLEQRRFADAAGALATVLDLNPSNTIAKSLLTEVTKRRAMAWPSAEAATGFTTHDFDALGHLAPVEAARALAPKIELLLQSVNEQRTALRIVEARSRAGQAGSKLFHRNSYHAGANGHIYAYHHGGRWEPQFDLGLFSGTQWGGNWMRMGLGFSLAEGGRDDRVQAAARADEGPEQILAYFEAFQREVGSTWRGHLADWMATSGGFIQYGARGPALDLLPKQAVEWLATCRNPAGHGWIFVGRWLSLDKPGDARTIGDMRKLVGAAAALGQHVLGAVAPRQATAPPWGPTSPPP
jgi:tetratricopeptide (TPR) repeat protein